MSKKSFFLGVLAGVVLTLACVLVLGLLSRNGALGDPVQYLDQPVSYEGKEEASFKVIQVVGGAALAMEESDRFGDHVVYNGNTVLVLGDNYYSDQVVTVSNPRRVGTYSYTSKAGRPMTVPVIDGGAQ